MNNIRKLSERFEKTAITRWKKEENKEEVLQEARKRDLIINSNDFKNFFDKVSKIPHTYMRFDDDIRGSFFSTRITHNYRGLFGWNIFNQNLKDILSIAFGAFKNRKYIYIFKVKDPSTLLKVDEYTEQMLYNDLEQVKKAFPHLSDFIDKMNERFANEQPFHRLEAILQDSMSRVERPKMEGAIDFTSDLTSGEEEDNIE